MWAKPDPLTQTLYLESILPNFFLHKTDIFCFSAWPFYTQCVIIFLCYKEKKLICKNQKTKKDKVWYDRLLFFRYLHIRISPNGRTKRVQFYPSVVTLPKYSLNFCSFKNHWGLLDSILVARDKNIILSLAILYALNGLANRSLRLKLSNCCNMTAINLYFCLMWQEPWRDTENNKRASFRHI